MCESSVVEPSEQERDMNSVHYFRIAHRKHRDSKLKKPPGYGKA